MTNRRKFTYIVGFIVLCWTAIAALSGIFLGLAHLLNNTTATIVVFQLIIYSGLFGFLGTQLYKRKDERDGWRRANTKERDEDEDDEDAGFAWKRDRKRKIGTLGDDEGAAD